MHAMSAIGASICDCGSSLLAVIVGLHHRDTTHPPTNQPPTNRLLQPPIGRYWWAMGNATRAQYPEPEASSAPHVWDYTQCMEVDGQFFFK